MEICVINSLSFFPKMSHLKDSVMFFFCFLKSKSCFEYSLDKQQNPLWIIALLFSTWKFYIYFAADGRRKARWEGWMNKGRPFCMFINLFSFSLNSYFPFSVFLLRNSNKYPLIVLQYINLLSYSASFCFTWIL